MNRDLPLRGSCREESASASGVLTGQAQQMKGYVEGLAVVIGGHTQTDRRALIPRES